jgi:hypothetical protein
MNLNKKTVARIEDVLDQLDRGIAFLDRTTTHVVTESAGAAFPESNWTSGTGRRGIAICKDIGSELCLLRNAQKRLRALITPVVVESA